jgi:DNA double-strand break repair helicase HerA and related ATPase
VEVEKTLVATPRCRMGAITDTERAAVRAGSPVGTRYDAPVNRVSATEMLAARRAEPAAEAAGKVKPARTAQAGDAERGMGDVVKDALFGTTRRQGMIETMAKQTARTVGNQVGRRILRGLLGGIFGGTR